MNRIVIIAPHCDDEVIGCFEILQTPIDKFIIYTTVCDQVRIQEASNLRNYCRGAVSQIFNNEISPNLMNKTYTYFFPDPINEFHPEHRKQGCIGERMVRNGFDVIFYSTLMNVPWIHELKEYKQKEDMLNKLYPSQKSLWEYEKKYVLYEARMKWLI